MSAPIIKIYDVETNEIVEREMTQAEFTQYEKDKNEITQKQNDAEAEAQDKATRKTALLAKLEISEDEARLLIS
jgi:hypothetical protein